MRGGIEARANLVSRHAPRKLKQNRNHNHRCILVKRVAVCGPLDSDDPAPAITLMLPTED
jgi:hypothetical protein